MTWLGIGFAVLAAVCLACQALSVRLATQNSQTRDILLIVLIINTIIFVPIGLVFASINALTLQALLAFFLAGVVSTLVGRAFFYVGVKRVGAARAEPLKATMPLHATILAILILDESATMPQLIGIIILILGVGSISWEGASHEKGISGFVDWWGLLFPLVAAFLYALEPIFAIVGFQEGVSVLSGLAIKMISALGIYVIFLVVRGDLPAPTHLTTDFKWKLTAGLASSGFLITYYGGLYVSRVGIVVPIMQTSPLIVAILALIFFRKLERVSWLLIFGSVMVVSGALLVTIFG